MGPLQMICAAGAGLFAIGWFYTRKVVVLVAALAWAAFVPYTYWMFTNCAGDCLIRLDLLLEVPLLFIVSLIALFTIALVAWRNEGRWRRR